MGEMERLRQRVEELEAVVRRLESARVGGEPPEPPGPGTESGVSRRGMIVTGAAALGASAVGLVAGGEPAAAVDFDPILAGTANTGVTLQTTLLTSASRGLVVSDDYTSGGAEAALTGMAGGSAVTNGVKGLATDHGTSPTNPTGYGIVAEAGREGSGVFLEKRALAQLLIRPDGDDPRTSGFAHRVGELVADGTSGALWYCVAAGTPGSWKLLARSTAPSVADLDDEIARLDDEIASLDADVAAADVGRITLVDPARVYDSRRPMAPTATGPLVAGSERVIPVRDARDAGSGDVIVPDAIPAGVAGVVYNLTVVNMSGAGFLAVAPSDAVRVASSSINWGPTTSGAIANSSLSKVAGDRELKVVCGGNGATDFVIDVVGHLG